ncbi:Fimbrial protein precursor [compost metagenome]
MKRTEQRGFSLIELMIVIGIIGVLVAIALPNYDQYRIKANRADAQAFLMEAAQMQQRFLMDSRAYVADPLAVPADVNSNYTITVVAPVGATPPTFIITATPKAGTRQAADGLLSIDQAGTKVWAGGVW